MRVPKHSASPCRSSLLRTWKVSESLSSMSFCQPIFQASPDVFLCLYETTCMSLRDVCSCEGQCSALIDMTDQDQPFMLLPAPLHTSHTHRRKHAHSPIQHINSLDPSLYYSRMNSHPFTLHSCPLYYRTGSSFFSLSLFPFCHIFVFLKTAETSSPTIKPCSLKMGRV